MKKHIWGLTILLFLIGAGIYSLGMFLLVEERETLFWSVYVFTLAAFVLSACVQLFVGGDAYASKAGVWSYPAVICGAVYLAVQLLTGIVLLACGASAKLAIVLQAVCLAAFAAVTAGLLTGMKHMEAADRTESYETQQIMGLIAEAERMYRAEANPDKKKELKKIFEALRYSDPVSRTAELQFVDEQIVQKMSGLSFSDSFELDAEAILQLIEERTVLCRRSK